jgi:hypothetical protein
LEDRGRTLTVVRYSMDIFLFSGVQGHVRGSREDLNPFQLVNPKLLLNEYFFRESKGANLEEGDRGRVLEDRGRIEGGPSIIIFRK